jgi:hypothetical protein
MKLFKNFWHKSVPTGIHSFFSDGNRRIKSYEIVNMLQTIFSWKYEFKGDFYLYTDSESYPYLKSLGLTRLYDSVIILSIHPAIRKDIFWAAGKMYAYQSAPVPFVSVDLDACVYKPFWNRMFQPDVMPLHSEPVTWDCYKNNVSDMLDSVTPYNVSVLGVFDKEFRDKYASSGIQYMINYNGVPVAFDRIKGNPKSGTVYFQEMMYVEQYCLDVHAQLLQKKISPITTFDEQAMHVSLNEYADHLWIHKAYLEERAGARMCYVDSKLEELRNKFPASASVITYLTTKGALC